MANLEIVQVRLSADVVCRLNRIAKNHDMTKSALVRVCVDKFLDEIESTGRISITQVLEDPEAGCGNRKNKKAG